MDLLQFLLTLVSIFIVLIFIRLLQSKTKICTVHKAPGDWPIMGHWRLYLTEEPAHRTLGAMADKCGPIFATKLGSQRILIVSSHEIAKECFTVHDKVLEKPSLTASKLLGYNNAMLTFSPYSSYWREMRKIATMELLTNHRIEILEHIRVSEVETALREIYMRWERKDRPNNGIMVDMKQEFHNLIGNICFRTIAGKRYFGESVECDEEEARKCQRATREFLNLFGVNVLSDLKPSLGWLDFLGYKKAMKRTAKELDTIMEGWLKDHKQERVAGGKEKEKEREVFLDWMLKLNLEHVNSCFDADTITKALCLDMILALSDTPMITLTWALALLLNNPRVLKKARDELDINIGNTRHVEESDINNLVYLQAVVKETFRLYPPVSIVSLRSAVKDFTLSKGNYQVPAGTQLMLNAWKIHRDPRVWHDPEQFIPERFLTTHKEVDVGGKSFKLVPFGAGRRSCPGVSLGVRIVHYVLARFLHSYEVTNPLSEDIDMTEVNALTNLRATPLQVLVTPRLDPKLYGVIK